MAEPYEEHEATEQMGYGTAEEQDKKEGKKKTIRPNQWHI